MALTVDSLTPLQQQVAHMAYDRRWQAEQDEAAAAKLAEQLVKAHIAAATSSDLASQWRAFAIEHTGIDVNELT